jgi:predicted RNA-binding protein associated with RNAse of E/G family
LLNPHGTIFEDDMDELEEGLREIIINQRQYKLAIEMSKRLSNALLFNFEPLGIMPIPVKT